MSSPALNLVLFFVFVALVAILAWPRRGVLAFVGRQLRMTDRVRMEDALKHLYKAELAGRTGTIESLAGALGVNRSRAVRIVATLESTGLMQTTGQGLILSDSGRDYALRIVRSHRLWERFLADRTGLTPAEWHEEAELHEHAMSLQETEDLSARMGHPRYDPHGDPIPTDLLELPPQAGVALTALDPGQAGRIIHLEDEPADTYRRLVDQGLAPNMEVLVQQADPERIVFVGEGQEHSLEPIEAANITVVPLADPDTVALESSQHTLAEIRPGESATVLGISSVCQGRQRRRLLDLGVVPGTVVLAEYRSAGGDPVAYLIRGALIALRRQQAEWIFVDPVDRTREEVA